MRDVRGPFGLRRENQRADVKLTFYRSRITDVIRRSNDLRFSKVAEQTIAGIEAEARVDTGGFYIQVGATFMTTNKVGDESAAVMADSQEGRVPNCVKYGFPWGYLPTQATPKTSANWTVGGRFLDRRLDVGGRLIYHGAYDNPFFEHQVDLPWQQQIQSYAFNVPYTWATIVTADAYARFRVGDRLSAELVGTNLNNRYFADPLTRSLMPVPGRTVRVILTGRFRRSPEFRPRRR